MSSFCFFSVVIPAYNRAHCILTAIDSVLQQSEEDFEIVVVDDGSVDNTFDVVADKAKFDSRIRVIKQDNGGASKARNAGINIAKGNYIALLDSDDIFLPHHLQQAREYLECNPDACVFSQVIVDRGNNIKLIKPHRGLNDGEHISDYLMADRGFVPTITLVIPRWVAEKVQYDENLSKGDDYDYAIRLVAAGCCLHMLTKPSAVWDDKFDANRLSSRNNTEERIAWLNRIRNLITDKAYYSELGWPVAKYLAEEGRMLAAFGFYFRALVKGCFRPKMAVVIFLQVALSKSAYRRFSNILARFGVQP